MLALLCSAALLGVQSYHLQASITETHLQHSRSDVDKEAALLKPSSAAWPVEPDPPLTGASYFIAKLTVLPWTNVELAQFVLFLVVLQAIAWHVVNKAPPEEVDDEECAPPGGASLLLVPAAQPAAAVRA
mmetsp:Transcript_29245/g.51157  ORF Transcript_29245/g.51157 Transcript_29245/m.51157 type:complete len:130 (+) Transcript_29245:69-458(+)